MLTVEEILSGKTETTKATKVNAEFNKPTQKQMETVEKFCKQKGLDVEPDRCKTKSDASDYIDWLYKYAPVSARQKELIEKLCDSIKAPYPDYKTLTGGVDGTASAKIVELQRLAEKFATATDGQVAKIVKMYFCPECESLLSDAEKAELGELKGKEFDEHLAKMVAKIRQGKADKYINDNKEKYEIWATERPTIKQMLSLLRLNTFIEGKECDDIISNKELSDYAKIKELESRQSWTYASVIQFTTEMASAQIIQFEKELKDKIWAESSLEPEDMRNMSTLQMEKSQDLFMDEYRQLVANLHVALGIEIDDDIMEASTLNPLKEVIELAQIRGLDVRSFFDRLKYFEPSTIDMLCGIE